VVKQSLARRALQAIDLPQAAETCTETMAFVFAAGDPSAISKVVMDFAKAVPAFRVSAGVLERRLLLLQEVTVLASLPPKPVLLAKVCGGMQAPIGRLVGVLQGTIHRVTLVVQAIRDRQGTPSSS
jgi:large subunit ribosomal protein L10